MVLSDCQVKYFYLNPEALFSFVFWTCRSKFNFFQCDAWHGARETWSLEEAFLMMFVTSYVMIVVDKTLEHCRLGSGRTT